LRFENLKVYKMAVATIMERPETVALTYDKANPIAKKALDFFLSLGVFQIKKLAKSQVEIGLEEYRQGKYTVINKDKCDFSQKKRQRHETHSNLLPAHNDERSCKGSGN